MSNSPLSKTRISLLYLASYLLATGIAFLTAPSQSIQFLGAVQQYDDIFVRFVGAFMIALGTLVSQIIRYRIAVLYPTTIVVRIFFIVCITFFYFRTSDPLFLAILAVVGLGFVLTAGGFLLDRRAK